MVGTSILESSNSHGWKPWDFPHREAAAELYESIDAAREAVNCYIAGEVWILDQKGAPLRWRSRSR